MYNTKYLYNWVFYQHIHLIQAYLCFYYLLSSSAFAFL